MFTCNNFLFTHHLKPLSTTLPLMFTLAFYFLSEGQETFPALAQVIAD